MIWRVSWMEEQLSADLDVAGPDLFQRAGDAVRDFAERGEGPPAYLTGSLYLGPWPGGGAG